MPPVTLDECKQHAVVDFADDDVLVQSYIEAATAHLDGFGGILGRALMEQTWEVELARLERSFVLPVPAVSALSILYLDAAGVEQAIDTGSVHHHAVANGTLVEIEAAYPLSSFRSDRRPRVRFTCGYATTADVPQALRVAIMMLVRRFYDDRSGEEGRKPCAMVDRLIAPYRWVQP